MYVENVFKLPIFKKPEKIKIQRDIERLKEIQSKTPTKIVPLIISKKNKEIKKIEIEELIGRPLTTHNDTDELLKQFNSEEKNRRRNLRNLTGKQINTYQRMSLKPERRNLKKDRLVNLLTEGASTDENEYHLAEKLNDRI